MTARATRIARKATDDSPAVGICCYRLPLAVCMDRRLEKPCYHAERRFSFLGVR